MQFFSGRGSFLFPCTKKEITTLRKPPLNPIQYSSDDYLSHSDNNDYSDSSEVIFNRLLSKKSSLSILSKISSEKLLKVNSSKDLSSQYSKTAVTPTGKSQINLANTNMKRSPNDKDKFIYVCQRSNRNFDENEIDTSSSKNLCACCEKEQQTDSNNFSPDSRDVNSQFATCPNCRNSHYFPPFNSNKLFIPLICEPCYPTTATNNPTQTNTYLQECILCSKGSYPRTAQANPNCRRCSPCSQENSKEICCKCSCPLKIQRQISTSDSNICVLCKEDLANEMNNDPLAKNVSFCEKVSCSSLDSKEYPDTYLCDSTSSCPRFSSSSSQASSSKVLSSSTDTCANSKKTKDASTLFCSTDEGYNTAVFQYKRQLVINKFFNKFCIDSCEYDCSCGCVKKEDNSSDPCEC